MSSLRSLLSLCLALTAFALSAQHVRLRGHVRDDSGSPMDIVHVRTANGAVGTLTNFKGEYELTLPAGDTVRVVFTSIGYHREERVVGTSVGRSGTDAAPAVVTLDVVMRPNQAYIHDVEVSTRRQQTGTMERLEAKDLRRVTTASGNAVEDMIGTLAGVAMNNELSSGYNVRGGAFDENLVYVNGIEVYRPQLISSGQQEGLSFINPDMVASINFSTGGFSAEYGDKMSSALDISYRIPERFEASAGIGLLGASASIGQRTRRFTQLHGIRYKRNTSMLRSLDTQGEYDPRFFDYQAFLTYALSDTWGLSLLGNIAQNTYRFRPESRETTFGTLADTHKFKVYFDGQERDEFDTWFGAVTLTTKALPSTELSLQASAFRTDEEVTYDIAGEYWLDEATDGGQSGLGVGAYHEHARDYLDATVAAITVKGVSQIGHHRLSYGLTTQSEHIRDRIAEWERRDSSGYTLPRTDIGLRMVANQHSFYDATTTRLSAYVQDQFGWNAVGGRLVAVVGLRLSHWSFNDETLLSPRLSLRYVPDAQPNLVLRLASGIYHQAPFYKEYRLPVVDDNGNTMVRMNDRIRSPRSLQFIAGGDYSFKAYDRPFRLSAEAYWKHISRHIPYIVDNVQIRYAGENQGSAFATGIDMKIYGEFVVGTDSWLSLSLMQAKETFDGLRMPRPTEQRYTIGLFFSDYWPGNDNYRVNLRGVMNDGLPFYAPLLGRRGGTLRTPPYRRVDLGAERVWSASSARFMRRGGWQYVSEMSVGLDIFNLLDIDNTNSYYWVTAIDNHQYAVPNYLTGRMLNVRMAIRF